MKKTKKHFFLRSSKLVLLFFWLLFIIPLILEFFEYKLSDFHIDETQYMVFMYSILFVYIIADFFFDKQKFLWIVEFITGTSGNNRK